MIQINHMSFAYDNELILQDVDITFESGMTHGIVGLNGSGKTTFFNLLSGILNADEGEILYDGKKIKKQDIAYIDAESFFYPNLTALEFLSVFPKTNANYHEAELANVFGIPLNEFIENYSTGMKKKLLIISQLKQDKALFIFDEPFNGLDIESNRSLQFVIRLLNQKNKTVLIASHIIEPLYAICHKIHHLKDKTFIGTYLPEAYGKLDTEVFSEFNERIMAVLSKSI
jgi:ABC-2 type transport system ATP-binding protein